MTVSDTVQTSMEQAAGTVEDANPEDRPARPWFSGWCGPGEGCNDERFTNKAGEFVRHCKYVAENGARAPRPVMYCACACHADANRAGQAVEVAQG